MFEESFLTNLIIFLTGQAAAWGYLRTGRLRRGVALMVGGWVLADAALLARFVYQGHPQLFVVVLLAMQAYSLGEMGLLVFGRVRRRRTKVRRRRGAVFREAFLLYLQNDLDGAALRLQRLRRADPWDLETALALGTVLARAGKMRQALGLLRAARNLDRDGRLRDVIRAEQERCLGTS